VRVIGNMVLQGTRMYNEYRGTATISKNICE